MYFSSVEDVESIAQLAFMVCNITCILEIVHCLAIRDVIVVDFVMVDKLIFIIMTYHCKS